MFVDSLVLVRQFKAPPARVFAAFTEKALIQTWFGPEGSAVLQCDVDARVGGTYRIELRGRDQVPRVVTGEFKDVQPPSRLVYSWAWLDGAGRGPETLVTLTFKAKDGGTELTLEQTGFASQEARAAHDEGWSSGLNRLGRSLRGEPVVIGDRQSPYVQALRFALNEKGVVHQHLSVPPHAPEVLQENPFGHVPAFRHGDFSIYETSAIMHYVDAVFPGPALVPESVEGKAKVGQWIGAYNAYVYPVVAKRYVMQYAIPRGENGTPDRAVIDAALPEVKKVLGIFDAAYDQTDYLVGNRLSLADILLAPMVRYVGMMPEAGDILAPLDNLRRAHAPIAARPGFVQATA